MRKKEPDFLFGVNQGAKYDRRLEIALEKAMHWQMNNVENEKVEYNGHTYHGPHKWIVCLIGSDAYSVNTFSDQ